MNFEGKKCESDENVRPINMLCEAMGGAVGEGEIKKKGRRGNVSSLSTARARRGRRGKGKERGAELQSLPFHFSSGDRQHRSHPQASTHQQLQREI